MTLRLTDAPLCLDQPPRTITTTTKPSDFPSLLRQKLSIVQTVERHKVQTEKIDANTDCPKCGIRGVRYSEVQQRSADEGSTILFNCVCGERYALAFNVMFCIPVLLTLVMQVVSKQLANLLQPLPPKLVLVDT